MKVLNLYACLGGNRYKWDEVANIEVTAVELDTELARLYSERFPNDTVIVGDAHQYLLDHYKEFDFIWSSPPCPSHSRARFWNSSNYDSSTLPVYPEMELYQQILFLKHYFKGRYIVENVIPFYDPLIPAKQIGRHLFWSNMNLKGWKNRGGAFSEIQDDINAMSVYHEVDISTYKGDQRKDKILRNLVNFDLGKAIFEQVVSAMKSESAKQISIF